MEGYSSLLSIIKNLCVIHVGWRSRTPLNMWLAFIHPHFKCICTYSFKITTHSSLLGRDTVSRLYSASIDSPVHCLSYSVFVWIISKLELVFGTCHDFQQFPLRKWNHFAAAVWAQMIFASLELFGTIWKILVRVGRRAEHYLSLFNKVRQKKIKTLIFCLYSPLDYLQTVFLFLPACESYFWLVHSNLR